MEIKTEKSLKNTINYSKNMLVQEKRKVSIEQLGNILGVSISLDGKTVTICLMRY